jgi:hypothetical protein
LPDVKYSLTKITPTLGATISNDPREPSTKRELQKINAVHLILTTTRTPTDIGSENKRKESNKESHKCS